LTYVQRENVEGAVIRPLRRVHCVVMVLLALLLPLLVAVALAARRQF
jgi:hypothetical protein